jgi:hypothetical protein
MAMEATDPFGGLQALYFDTSDGISEDDRRRLVVIVSFVRRAGRRLHRPAGYPHQFDGLANLGSSIWTWCSTFLKVISKAAGVRARANTLGRNSGQIGLKSQISAFQKARE